MILALETIGALVLLFAGGESLVRGASSLAARLGVSRLAVGATVVAFGTSMPELVVSLEAAGAGAGDIALGNVVGSNIANIALILGLSALFRPLAVHSRMLRMDIPVMVGVTLALIGLLATTGVTRIVGVALLVILAAFLRMNFARSRRESADLKDEIAAQTADRPTRWFWSAALVVAGLAGLILGGRMLVSAAVEVATALGVSDAIIGLTIVAVGTSLPELVTSVLATLRGQVDIAVGNVVGSNIFNIAGILGVSALVKPLPLGGIGWIDLAAMAAASVGLLILATTDRSLDRREGAGMLLFYAAYTAFLVAG